jgi:hypothetical protein
MSNHASHGLLERVSPAAEARGHRAVQARAASGRRRYVDPATCERDYSAAEQEFMNSMQAYKASSGRMFPTWSEVLEVLNGLGYEKVSDRMTVR